MTEEGKRSEYQVTGATGAFGSETEIVQSGATVISTVTVRHSSIFIDKDLFEVDHVPDSILHRESQITEIKYILADSIRPKNIIGLGGFGTGKTAVVRHICRDLPPGYRAIYVTCSKANTQTRVLMAILAALRMPVNIGYDQTYYRELVETELKRHRYVILILDEVDQFLEHRNCEADGFFYIFSRMPEWKNVVAILLSNRFDVETLLRTHLDPRTLDTFRWKRVEFSEYDAVELGDILMDRCKRGLKEGAFDSGTVAQIARLSYNQGLGARGLIDITREAGLFADRKHHDKISEEDVREASSSDENMKNIQNLTPIDKGLVRAVFLKMPILTHKLHRDYFVKLAERYGGGQSLATCERHIQKLQTFGLVKNQKGRGRGRGSGSETWLTIRDEMLSAVKSSLENMEEPS
jgi:cell division control protein 6